MSHKTVYLQIYIPAWVARAPGHGGVEARKSLLLLLLTLSCRMTLSFATVSEAVVLLLKQEAKLVQS